MSVILDDLREQIKRKEVVVFIGAGVSIATTKGNKVTNWKGLLEHGIEYIINKIAGKYDSTWKSKILAELDSNDIDDLISVATKIEKALTRNDKFSDWLNTAFGELEVADDSLIKAIVNLDVPIVTTNYDYLLEKVSGFNHATWDYPHNIEPILRRKNDHFRKHIIHLHGYFDKPDTIILGYDSYHRITQDQKIQTILRAIRTLKTILFIGVGEGISDPNFENFRQWCSLRFKDSKYSHYRLVISSEVDKCRLEHRPEEHIQVISYGDKHEDLVTFIQSLQSIKGNENKPEVDYTIRKEAETKSLSLYLSTIYHNPNAWSKFFGYVDFVGRKEEVKILIDFSLMSLMGNISWFVIYGSHGVGKSRLAMEWLTSLKEKGWATGFVEFIPDQLKELLNYIPDNNTALVIDNTENYNEFIWIFIYSIFQKWRGYNIQIRLLLIAQIDLFPSTGNSAITESVISLRHQAGLKIEVLSDIGEKRQLFELASSQTDANIPEVEILKLIEQSGGRPAFLALAGTYKQDWKNRLTNYANEKLKKAQNLFGDDGIRILVLSALVGTISDTDRELIAPNANNPAKLSEIFSKPVSYVSEYIPGIEPDLFAYEIIYSALSNYFTNSNKVKLLSEIVERFPETVLDRVINMWREENNASNSIYLTSDILKLINNDNNDEKHLKFKILEQLFDIISTKITNRSVNSNFSKLSSLRATSFATALSSSESNSNQTYRSIVELLFLKNMPHNGWKNCLEEIHKYLPASNETKLYWASIIDVFLGSKLLGDKLESKLQTEKKDNHLISNSITDENISKILIFYLESSNPIYKVYACFIIIDWCWSWEKKSISSLIDFSAILTHLVDLLKSGVNAYIISGASAIRWIVKGNKEIVDANRIQESDKIAAINVLLDNKTSEVVFECMCLTVGTIYQTLYKDYEIISWFKVAPLNYKVSFSESSNTPISTENITKISDLYNSPNLSIKQTKDLTILLLKIGVWNKKVADIISLIIFDDETTEQLNKEIIVRLAKIKTLESVLVLTKFIAEEKKKFSPDIQLSALTCLLYFESFKLLQEAKISLKCDIPNISIQTLEQEWLVAKAEGFLSGVQTNLLFDKLYKLYLSKKGHQIHKLKAKDTTGNWAYYFVHVLPEVEDKFMEAIKSDGTIDLDEYGNVIISNYGESPSKEIVLYLKENYDFDI